MQLQVLSLLLKEIGDLGLGHASKKCLCLLESRQAFNKKRTTLAKQLQTSCHRRVADLLRTRVITLCLCWVEHGLMHQQPDQYLIFWGYYLVSADNPLLDICSLDDTPNCEQGAPCSNAFHSFDSDVDYLCDCPPGFIGHNCETVCKC